MLASENPRARERRLATLTIALAALALYLPGIGDGDFVGDDEALDAGVISEMHRTGDWLFAEFNGEYLPPKPPSPRFSTGRRRSPPGSMAGPTSGARARPRPSQAPRQ